MKKTTLTFLVLFSLAINVKVKGQAIFLSDTTNKYSLNVVHTFFQEYACDIVNCVRNDTVFTLRAYAVYDSPLKANLIPDGFIKRAFLNQIEKGFFVTDFKQLVNVFVQNKFSVDTAIVSIGNQLYLITDNFQPSVFVMQQDNDRNTANVRITQSNFFSILRGNTDVYKNLGNGLQQKVTNKGDTLSVVLKNVSTHRTYTFAFVNLKGLIAFTDIPVLTGGLANKYLQQKLSSTKEWDYIPLHDFEFVPQTHSE